MNYEVITFKSWDELINQVPKRVAGELAVGAENMAAELASKSWPYDIPNNKPIAKQYKKDLKYASPEYIIDLLQRRFEKLSLSLKAYYNPALKAGVIRVRRSECQ